jgi:hypothetical protein
MDDVEALVNELNDMDLGWWPFLFLRPRKTECITGDRCFVLAALNGLPLGLFLDIVMRSAPPDEHVHPAVLPLALTLGLFVVHRATFSYFWNRRAERLRRAHERKAAWRQEEDS